MAVTTTNLIQGPATIYAAPFGTVETTLLSSLSTAPTGDWRDLGGTQDGVNLSIEQEFAELTVDQVVDRVGSRLTARNFTVETNLAEATLENLKFALNGGDITSGVYTPADASTVGDPDYTALVIDGWAPGGKRRRIIIRKALNIESVEFAYSKEDQTVLSVSFAAHYVSSTVKPFVVADEPEA